MPACRRPPSRWRTRMRASLPAGPSSRPSSSRSPKAPARAARRPPWCNARTSLPPPRREVIERYHQPALVETYLPGREFTVGIVGNGEDARVLGVCEILLKADAEANVYSLHNKELCEELVIYAPAADDEARLAGTRALARLSCARVPRRGAHRFPLRRPGRALFPRGQPARRPQSVALRPADPRRAERHRVRRR